MNIPVASAISRKCKAKSSHWAVGLSRNTEKMNSIRAIHISANGTGNQITQNTQSKIQPFNTFEFVSKPKLLRSINVGSRL